MLRLNRAERRKLGQTWQIVHADDCVHNGSPARAPWGAIGTRRSPFKSGGAL